MCQTLPLPHSVVVSHASFLQGRGKKANQRKELGEQRDRAEDRVCQLVVLKLGDALESPAGF